MLKNVNRSVLSAIVATQIIFTGILYTSKATAAPRCSALIVEASKAKFESGFNLISIDGVENVKLKTSTINNLKKVFEKYNLELKTNKIKTIIEIAARSVKGTSDTGSIEQSNKMAEIGREILETVKGDLKDVQQVKMVTYMIAEAVLRLENFKIAEYKSGEMNVFTKKSAVHINKFHDLVESYIDATPMYRDMANDAGLLPWAEIRGLYTNNTWIIGIRHHDMYHLHYSYGHPYYLAVNLEVSRSVNDRRYMMISSLWESVDTFKTSFEQNMAKYMKIRNMTAEDGMLLLAGATEKELDAIEAEVGQTTAVSQFGQLAYSAGWRPTKTSFGRGTIDYTEGTYVQEISDYINESLRRMKKDGSARYVNYHRQGPGVTVEVSEDSIPHVIY